MQRQRSRGRAIELLLRHRLPEEVAIIMVFMAAPRVARQTMPDISSAMLPLPAPFPILLMII